jgi:O-antigen ligase
MKIDPPGEPLSVRRLLLFVVAPLVCIAAMAPFILPGSVVNLVVVSLLALPLFVVLFDRPQLIFFLLVFILFSNLDVYAPFRLYRVMLGFFFVSFAVAYVQGRRVVTHHPIMIALLVAFAIIALQSLSVAGDIDAAQKRLGSLLKNFVAIAVIAQFTGNRRDFRRFVLVAVAGVLTSNFLPLIIHPPSKFASLSMIWNRGVVRYEGFVFEPNTFAMFQIFLVPLLMFCVAAFRRPRIARPVFIAAIVASIVVLVLSFSRGGFVALVVIMLLLLFLERRNKPILVSGLAVFTGALIYSPHVYWERIATVLNPGAHVQDFAVFTRLETMRVALRLGLEHPWLGVGIENFIYQSAYYVPYKLVVHNSFLEIFSELGAIALALFLAVIVYNVTILIRLVSRRDDPGAAQIGNMLLIQQAAILVCSFFIPSAYEMIFWFALALPAIADYAYRPEARSASEG